MPKKILIVDDDEDLVGLLKFELDSSGYQVMTAANGEEALKVLEKFMPNLILSDVTMPVMDGVDFFQALRNKTKTEKIPVLILTGSSNLEKYFRILKIGDFVSKPFDMELLHHKVKHLIDYDERLRAVRDGKSRAQIRVEDSDKVIYVRSHNRIQKSWNIALMVIALLGLFLMMVGPKIISAVVEFVSSN